MANEGRDNNANWDGIWDVKTRITETGWVAEIWIPFRTLKFGDADPQVWGINFERKLRRLNEDSYWSPIPRIYDAQRVSLAGTLEGMRGLHAGKNIRVKPYALTSGSRITTTADGRRFPGRRRREVRRHVGLVWDFTVNTDFSQVEADEQQVNLTRFNLFFPEKRDFFLENQGIFAFGDDGGRVRRRRQLRRPAERTSPGHAAVLHAAHRTVRRRPGAADSRRHAAERAAGRLLDRRAEHPAARGQGVPATNFTALRLRRDVLANSDVGAVLLDKEVSGPGLQPPRRLRRELPFRQPAA